LDPDLINNFGSGDPNIPGTNNFGSTTLPGTQCSNEKAECKRTKEKERLLIKALCIFLLNAIILNSPPKKLNNFYFSLLNKLISY
jgi:hypothetical protein